MELTPQLLDEQEFPVVLRGYDTDAVDDFLERVGAGVAALLDRIEQARRRLVDLEAELAVAKAAPPPEDPVERQVREVSRTLVLAQEAADTALAEARAEATSLRAEAQTEADRTLRTARSEADEMVEQARRAVEERKASAAAEIDAHAALRRVEREDELDRLAAEEQRARADLQRVHEQLELQRQRLSAVAAAATALMQSHDLEPVGSPVGADEPGLASARERSEEPGDDEAADEPTSMIDTLPVEDEVDLASEPAAAAGVNGQATGAEEYGSADAAAGEQDSSAAGAPSNAPAGEEVVPARPTGEASPTAAAPAATDAPPTGPPTPGPATPGPATPGPATPGPATPPAPPAGSEPGRSAEPAQTIPPSPPPRVVSSTAAGDSGAPVAASTAAPGAGPALAVAEAASASSAVSAPAVEGTTFFRPDAGGRGLFDQDEAPAVASPPRLRSVAPPDDDPFLAALRGDDQAAALLNEQPAQDEENPTGLMRLLRRR